MDDVTPNSVALVVTSPPYFAGKDYELVPGEGTVPGDYLAYLAMLTDVFRECVDKLEPGGRIAVNVANLGRKPYRSLSADVITILTPQEIQVASLVKDGKASKEIAGILNVSETTVHFHRKNLRKKFGLSNSQTNLRSYLISIS